MEFTKETSGKLILEYRAESGISQIEFSKKSGLSKLTIHNLESGKFKPNNMSLYKIKKFFDGLKYDSTKIKKVHKM